MNASARLRTICLALPDAHEQTTWDAPTFRVRGRIFAMESGRDGRLSVWLKAPAGLKDVMVEAEPARFFSPPYLRPKGWVALWLDGPLDWDEVAALVRRSYGLIAPRRLAARLASDEANDASGITGRPDRSLTG